MKKLIISMISLLLFASCAHMQNSKQVRVYSNLTQFLYPQGHITDHKEDQIPNLRLPLKVGVAFVPESSSSNDQLLTEVEKHAIADIVSEKFSNREYIGEIKLLPGNYLSAVRGFTQLQQVATLFDVDVMALISYDQLSQTTENRFSLSYLTVVGAFMMPGEDTYISTFMDISVFDMETQKLLLRAPGTHTINKSHTAFGDKGKLINKKRDSLLTASGEMIINLESELNQFEKKVKNGDRMKVTARPGYQGGVFAYGLLLFAPLCFIRKKGLIAEK